MDYKTFQEYREIYRFDEAKIIGKDICTDDGWIHIVSLTRRDHKAYLCVLEQQDWPDEMPCGERGMTHRESMLRHARENGGAALGIKQVKIGADEFQMQSGSCGNLGQQENIEAFIFFQQMMTEGWSLSEESPFYSLSWNRMGLAELELADEYEKLPELRGEISFTARTAHRTHVLELPVRLERGGAGQQSFLIEGKGEVLCHINRVDVINPREDVMKTFDSPQYREMVLQHWTLEEFEERRKSILEMVEAECPEGMGYFAVEYECTADELSVQIYAAELLDSVPEPKDHTSALFLHTKPEKETGPHGLRSRCVIVQHPVPLETEVLDAELFTVVETFPEKTYRL